MAIAQLGAVSPTFGREHEFAAVAAAVLGGVSLFGGRGPVLPGVLLGAVLVQTVENGLVIVNADPYLYPLVIASVIFLAVCSTARGGGSDQAGPRQLHLHVGGRRSGQEPAQPLTAPDLVRRATAAGVGCVQIADNLPLDALGDGERRDLRSLAAETAVGDRGRRSRPHGRAPRALPGPPCSSTRRSSGS